MVYKSFNYLTESEKLLFVDKELSKNYIIFYSGSFILMFLISSWF